MPYARCDCGPCWIIDGLASHGDYRKRSALWFKMGIQLKAGLRFGGGERGSIRGSSTPLKLEAMRLHGLTSNSLCFHHVLKLT